MFAVDVCDLPETGGSIFVVIAGLFVLVAGVIVTRWVRQSAGRLSVVVAPLVLLGGFMLAPQVVDPCAPATTTVAASTTTVPQVATTVPQATTSTTVPSATTTVAATTTTVAATTTTVPSATTTVAATTTTVAATTTTVAATTTTVAATTTTVAATTTTVAATTTTVAATTTTVALACASGGLCAVGDTGPGGGIVFYDAGSVQSWGRYLEAAPVGDEVQRTWATGGNQNAAVSGADGTAIGTGEQNTADIVAQSGNQSGNVAATSAAVYCSELVSGGQSDWFLPSKDELNLMYTNLRSASTPLGGFSSGYYWSSSESGGGTARYQQFFIGFQGDFSKNRTGYVRPVRAF